VSDELVGTTLGHCVIRGLLGEGGMAAVYRAYQASLDREVAIKVLPIAFGHDQSFADRFNREARAMARLSHPNIVTIHDAGEDQGRLYIVMAYIPGGTLKDRMAGPLDLREVVRVVNGLAQALSYAHERGIVHRDVKPVNVLMDTDGRPILSDFGIVKVMTEREGLTRAGAGVGTPEYMSPEQCRGGPVDARADIYALGVLVFEMLTGRTPFEADNYTAIAHAHIYEQPPLPSRLNPRISPAVQAVILKALNKQPQDRFQHATDFALALEQAVAAQMPMTSAAHPRALTPGVAVGQVAGLGVCPRCRAPNALGRQFCTQCGSPLLTQSQAPTQATCGQCGYVNATTNRFCTRCGNPLPSAGTQCRQCGGWNAPGTRYCTQCGHPLASA
jgi:serine/threonine protein kinase/ribosomal protein S27AE